MKEEKRSRGKEQIYSRNAQNAYFKPSADCCDECTIGRRLRFLEAEYSDVTGWSHSKW